MAPLPKIKKIMTYHQLNVFKLQGADHLQLDFGIPNRIKHIEDQKNTSNGHHLDGVPSMMWIHRCQSEAEKPTSRQRPPSELHFPLSNKGVAEFFFEGWNILIGKCVSSLLES